MTEHKFEAAPLDEGRRLDIFLTEKFPELSRSYVQRMIFKNEVCVNGKISKANYKIRSGDLIEAALLPAAPVEAKAENIPLDILYEDSEIIVVNKPRGLVVHPGAGNYEGTLVNALLGHCGDLSGINGFLRPGIVHRLDKDTSGVMVVAKSDMAHLNLALQIKNRTMSRKYLAIVKGEITENSGIIKAPIGRDCVQRKKMAVTFTNSKEAITAFWVKERFKDFKGAGKYTLLECKLLTGRTHQIRVHLSYIGHPVAGDPKYGGVCAHFKIKGQALHSKELILEHPSTKKELCFTAPLPEDMKEILKILS